MLQCLIIAGPHLLHVTRRTTALPHYTKEDV
jgi:hypothetical protein